MSKRVVAVGSIIQTPEKTVKVILSETRALQKVEVGSSGHALGAWEIHAGLLSPNTVAEDLFRS